MDRAVDRCRALLEAAVVEFSWARNCACCLAFVFVCLGSPGEVGCATVRAQEGGHECVAFEKSPVDHELVFRAKNSCERRLACTLSYRLSCEGARGRITSSTELRVAFQLASKAERNLTLSAASCKQGFRIEDVEWKCA